jgi:hypothetical protein
VPGRQIDLWHFENSPLSKVNREIIGFVFAAPREEPWAIHDPVLDQNWVRFCENVGCNQRRPRKSATCVTSRGSARDPAIRRNLPASPGLGSFLRKGLPATSGRLKKSALCVTSRGAARDPAIRRNLPTSPGLGSFLRKGSPATSSRLKKSALCVTSRGAARDPPFRRKLPASPGLGSFLRKDRRPQLTANSKTGDLRHRAAHL